MRRNGQLSARTGLRPGQHSCSNSAQLPQEAYVELARTLSAATKARCFWTLEEIGRLIVRSSGNPSETLTNIVHPDPAAVRHRRLLGLPARARPRQPRARRDDRAAPESVGRVRMRLTEGLAGLVAEQLQPQVVADATTHPRFKYFPEAGEDPYHSFLGVPLDRSRPAAGRPGRADASSRASSAATTCGCS